jgi:hypothetical protein
MENISKPTEALSRRDVAYYRRRNQTRLFAELAAFFASEAEAGRVTRKEIAQMLGKDPAQITRWLSSPSNLELDTVSDLLLTMGAEMDHRIVRFSDRPKANYAHPVYINTGETTTTEPVTRLKIKEAAQPVGQMKIEATKQSETTASPINVEIKIHAAV